MATASHRSSRITQTQTRTMARILALALALIAPATAFVAPSARAAARAAPLQANSLPLNGWEPDSSKFAYGLPGTLDPVPDFDPAGLSADVSLDDIKLWLGNASGYIFKRAHRRTNGRECTTPLCIRHHRNFPAPKAHV